MEDMRQNFSEIQEINVRCRVCLQETEEMNPFFELYFEDLSLSNVFKTITTYEILEDDRLSKYVCENCSAIIINFNNMLSVFQETEAYLNKVVSDLELESKYDRVKEENIMDSAEDPSDNIDDNELIATSNIVENDVINAITGNIQYFGDDTLDNVIEYEEHEETTGSSIADNLSDVDDPGENGVKIEYELSNNEPPVEEEIIGNGEYKRVKTMKYTCECGDTFLYRTGFRLHLQQKHEKVTEELNLEQYASEVKYVIPLGLPLVEFVPAKGSRRNKLQCRKCTKCFPTIEEVKTHEQIHKTHVCHYCGAAFLRKNYLTDHIAVHSEEKKYVCKVCNRAFRQRHSLSVHTKIHLAAKPYICEQCGVCFRARGTLVTHRILKHSNERNYVCSICSMRFNLKSTLDKHHLRKHTGGREKSFICNKCGVAYLNKTTLTRHIADKHLGQGKRYPCNICGLKVYTLKKGLRMHLQRKHNIY
ncbi:unnamed protein product [Phaedon cochleariae]|uniref:Zinc finger protein n=1 Tax=Phaedon cochleariae TaxID=80249 RepID=A0A9P0DHR3_PHACE|nr:unnamed protein product [Phaedon cochleariae]